MSVTVARLPQQSKRVAQRNGSSAGLEQRHVDDLLYEAAVSNGVVGDDGDLQTWATIRSGLSAGLNAPIDLDENE